jgi:hypothetical protein
MVVGDGNLRGDAGRSGLVTVTVAAVVALALAGSGCSTSPAAVPPVAVVGPSPLDLVPPWRQPGTPDWRIANPVPPHTIAGFADRTSALPGEPVRLFVSTTAASFEFWRATGDGAETAHPSGLTPCGHARGGQASNARPTGRLPCSSAEVVFHE